MFVVLASICCCCLWSKITDFSLTNKLTCSTFTLPPPPPPPSPPLSRRPFIADLYGHTYLLTVYKKGYQETDNVVSSIILKVKGSGVTCEVAVPKGMQCPADQVRVWDPADYVIPAQENNAMFVQTNNIGTQQWQRAEGWTEDPDAAKSGNVRVYPCKQDSDCKEGLFSRNGVLNGKCDVGDANSTNLCMIYGWGPVELKARDAESLKLGYHNQMPAAENFTLFLKNSIFFPKFDAHFSNVDGSSSSYLSSCVWDPINNTRCPIFRLGDIAKQAGVVKFADIMVAGAVISVNLDYDCNLDSQTSECPPQFSFGRVDSNETKLSMGYNFRWAKYWFGPNMDSPNNTYMEQRRVYKSYGVRFIFYASGTAGRFSMVPLLLALGSGMGLLSVATLIADQIVTKLLRHRKYYTDHKYEEVEDPDKYGETVPLINAP